MFFNKITNGSTTTTNAETTTGSFSSLTTASTGSVSSLASNMSGMSLQSQSQPTNVREAITMLSKEGRFRGQYNRQGTPGSNQTRDSDETHRPSYKMSQDEKLVSKILAEKANLSRSDSTFSKNGKSDDEVFKQPAKPTGDSANRTKMSSVPPASHRKVSGYIGFSNIPNQIYRKAVKKGFEFNMMVVGESGLGKSTLVNSMFLTDIYSESHPGPSRRVKQTVNVEKTQVLLKESSVNLSLTVIDTPGFGDAIDNSECWTKIVDYVNDQFENYLNGETRVNRTSMKDTRVHACIYFIAPTGHGLKPLDVEFMRKLQDKVNIIPIIAKADTMTREEITYFKEKINRQLFDFKIKTYEFPEDTTYAALEEKDRQEYANLRARVPFAVVCSNTWIESSGDSGSRKIRGRRYPWGVVDIENPDHSDFVPLRTMLIRTNLLDLCDVTNNVLYENYRCRKLASLSGSPSDVIPNKNPLATLEDEQKDLEARIKKMEQEMEDVFEKKVQEKKMKLELTEQELQAKYQEANQKIENDRKAIAEIRETFISERRKWELQNNITIEELKKTDATDCGIKKRTLPSMASFRLGR